MKAIAAGGPAGGALGSTSIVRLDGRVGGWPDDETAPIVALAEEAFPGEAISVAEELTRPWVRVWLAAPGIQADPTRAAALLVAWHVADELHVLHVATVPRFRRSGLAIALLDRALDYAAQSKIHLILLEVRRSNRPAIELYRKLGFSVMGVRPRYYADNDEDALEMMLALDPITGKPQPGRDENTRTSGAR